MRTLGDGDGDALGPAHAAVAAAGPAGGRALAHAVAVGALDDLLEVAQGRSHRLHQLPRTAARPARLGRGPGLVAAAPAGCALLQAVDLQLLAARMFSLLGFRV